MESSGMIRLKDAADLLGTNRQWLRRRIVRGDLPVYTNPRDGRSRLVRIVDVQRFATPRLYSPADEEVA